MGLSFWQILTIGWLVPGLCTLLFTHWRDRRNGGNGLLWPPTFDSLKGAVTTVLIWPLVLLIGSVAMRREAISEKSRGFLLLLALTVILMLPLLLPLMVIGFILRRIRGTPPPPAIDMENVLRLAPWPGPADERALLARIAGAPDLGNPPPLAELRERPEARLLETAWLYVGLRVARVGEEEALHRLEAARGATHDAHPRELLAYLQWRQQQDDPGGPAIDPSLFARTAAGTVNWVCDRYQEHTNTDIGEPEQLVEVDQPDAIAPRRVQNALMHLIMAEGDELYRCVSEEAGADGVLLVREGEPFAHLAY